MAKFDPATAIQRVDGRAVVPARDHDLRLRRAIGRQHPVVGRRDRLAHRADHRKVASVPLRPPREDPARPAVRVSGDGHLQRTLRLVEDAVGE